LKEDVELANRDAAKVRLSSDDSVSALSQELRQFKIDLDRLKLREKQVSEVERRGVIFDFRNF
jgi:hypothetical protein